MMTVNEYEYQYFRIPDMNIKVPDMNVNECNFKNDSMDEIKGEISNLNTEKSFVKGSVSETILKQSTGIYLPHLTKSLNAINEGKFTAEMTPLQLTLLFT